MLDRLPDPNRSQVPRGEPIQTAGCAPSLPREGLEAVGVDLGDGSMTNDGGASMHNLNHNHRVLLGVAVAVVLATALVVILAVSGGGGGSY
jgi:hypothetical protein